MTTLTYKFLGTPIHLVQSGTIITGPQPKGRGRGGRGSGSAFVDNTEPPSEPENSLGIDPVAARGDTSSSDETHTPPSPKGPPKAKPRPKPAEPKAKAAEPKQPDTPPPGWTPSLRPADHPIVTTSVRSIHQLSLIHI